MINTLENTTKDITFIQLGGNDGIYVDPIHKYYVNNQIWKGYVFEPNPEIFEKLTNKSQLEKILP